MIILSFFVGLTQSKPGKIDNTKELDKIKSLESELIKSTKTISNIDDLGIHLPTLEESENCIPSHLIKVKLEKGSNKYYTKENKLYTRIKADMCLKDDSILTKFTSIKKG